jgi:phage terminase large subunit-like protein
VPKKNSKTTGGAGIMLTALLMNERPNAELLFVGPTQEIANLAFEQASGMIEADESYFLSKRFQVRDHVKEIIDRKTGATLKIKTFDMKVMTGSKPVIVLVDELHIMSSFSFASRVIGQIRGGLLANPESLLIFITTQSDQPPAGVFKAELQRARGIRDGRIVGDVRTLPILYEFPEAMQIDPAKPWLDPANWPMVTPNLGLSIDLDRLISDFKTANELGEAEVRRWASQHLNVEIGLALHTDRWRGADYWQGAMEPGLTLETMLERCDVAVVGIDGGGLDDLYAAGVLGRCKVTKDWLWWCHAWVHDDVFAQRKDIAERLQDFIDAGDLTLCEDPTQDIREIADLVERIKDAGLLPDKNAVGLDAQGVAALVDELAARGLTQEQMVAIAQGYRLSRPIWGAERKLKDGTLWHADQAMTAWCVGNAKVVQQGSAVLITKEVSGKAKIDPDIALFNAVELMSRNPEPPAGAVDYERLIMAGGGLR